MKLKNKKTGKIVDFKTPLCMCDDKSSWQYDSLSELEEDWEDYEELKELYWINYDGSISHAEEGTMSFVKQKQIGNYFETKEEAEKAVEKLKALTEAKEDGLKIKGYYYNHEDLVILADIGKCNKLTLDTLFGKEVD